MTVCIYGEQCVCFVYLVCIHSKQCVCSASCCPWQLWFFFDFLLVLNQACTSCLSDDKCSFGRFCQRAQLPSQSTKTCQNLPFTFPFLCRLPSFAWFYLIPLSKPLSLLPTHEQDIGLSLLFSPSHLLHLSIFPFEEINRICPPCEKTNTDYPACAAGMWPRISQPF